MDKRIVLAGLSAGCIAFAAYVFATRFFGLSHALVSFLDARQAQYAGFVAHNFAIVIAAFIVTYTLVVTLALPLTGTMDVVGGAVLGLAGFPAAVFSICVGSIVPFLVARKLGAVALARFESGLVARVQRGFIRKGFQYLILMRLMPWAPCSVTTIISGALGMRLGLFLLGTGIGFIPAGLALNLIGRGLRRIGDGGDVSLVALYHDPDFLLAAAGVCLIALLGLWRSRLSKRSERMNADDDNAL